MPTLEIKETNQTVEVKSGVPSASQLQGDPIPSNPSPGDVLRSDGTEWGHLPDTEHGKLHKVVEGTVNAGHPDFTDPYDTSTRAGRASAVDDAITFAGNNSHPLCLVPDSLLDYDASSVTFDNSVRMVREGQIVDGADPVAYGCHSSNTKAANRAGLAAAVSKVEADGGGRVTNLKSGTYPLTRDSIEIDTDNVEIRSGPGVTWKLADGENSGSQTHNFFKIGSSTPPDGVTIKGGTYDQNRANNSTTAPTGNSAALFLNNNATAASAASEDFTVENVTLINCFGQPINVIGVDTSTLAKNIRIIGCDIRDCEEGVTAASIQTFKFLNNSMRNILNQQDGVEPRGTIRDVVVASNTFRDMGGSFIDVRPNANGTPENVVVKNNVGFKAGQHGLAIGAVLGLVEGNLVINPNDSDSGNHGIKVLAESDRVAVRNNGVHDKRSTSLMQRPVDIASGAQDTVVEDNSFSGAVANTVSDSGTNSLLRNNQNGRQVFERGTTTLSSGSTAKFVNPPNVGAFPGIQNVQVMPAGDLGNASYFWVTYGSNDFTIHVDTDPGQDVEFSWVVDARDSAPTE